MENIPNDVIVNIAALVGSSSVVDLCNFKQCCKTLNQLGGDNLVFKKVSMEKLPTIPWFPLSQQANSFLERCRQVQNADFMYRVGMMEYFSEAKIELGCLLLEKAMLLGHVEATYVLGIILICTESRHSRMKGIELLKKVESFRKRSRFFGFLECRDKCAMILSQMWIKQSIRLETPICTVSNCSKTVHIFSDGYDYGEYDCEACMCERDVRLFCQLL